ncbi:hypothetical protein [Zobellia galactanivorans]|uniref:Hypothetical lipoprotein n=1 Tax=Zobellia galactanivorans (strain DSM 12802 / CCUG 47099 / CIP 106680 / NCIMB 13871 / Dsij) TaxID=63186 RepID=G0L6M3_ZOBGA|nr:hypothetical protein [Zobellia galactanivorans]CAZ98512.1 Hypothetical lipoprotein [Zobellia galactanivorans]
MKYQILFIGLTSLFISCSNNKKAAERLTHVSNIKSDILLESTTNNTLNLKHEEEFKTLTISGKNLLKGTATLKVTNKNGEELKCETFPAVKLIHQEYKTANSTLKEKHLRDVVKGYFIEENSTDMANLY